MPWEELLKKLAKKAAEAKEAERKLNSENINLQSEENKTSSKDQKPQAKPQKDPEQKPKRYYLGKEFGKIYFTGREGLCMSKILQGKTVERIGSEIGLSPRTIEFYVKNMKTKVGCRTKFELIDIVHVSDFLHNFNTQKQNQNTFYK